MTNPNIFEFQNIADFLKSFASYQKAKAKTWSLQVWARKLKLKDKTPLLRAVNGTRPVSEKLEQSLLSFFGFGQLEADYFRILAAYSRMKAADSPIDIRGVLKAKNAAAETRVLRVPPELKDLFMRPMSNWLRTMAHGSGLPVEPGELVKKFRIDVDPNEVFDTVARLSEAGLLVKNKKGDRWELTETNIVWATAKELGMRESNLKQLLYMEAVCDRLKSTIDNQADDRVRTFATMLKLNAGDLALFTRRIHDAVCEVAATFESAGGDITFQAQVTGLQIARED